MPSRRSSHMIAASVVVIALVASVVIFFAPKEVEVPVASPAPAPSWAPPAAPPVELAAPASVSIADLVDPDWVRATSLRTGIPELALNAYAGAAVWKSKQKPECGITWNTLAAIGYVESRHGTYGGAMTAMDGTITPPIYGVVLDGVATAHIPDSDGGKFDKDKKYDRAIGPMQMIPQSWKNWRWDANNDHHRDPQNMYDAVMAAANYLCRASDDMVGVVGWQAGIASYNSAPSYLHAVARAALEYAAGP